MQINGTLWVKKTSNREPLNGLPEGCWKAVPNGADWKETLVIQRSEVHRTKWVFQRYRFDGSKWVAFNRSEDVLTMLFSDRKLSLMLESGSRLLLEEATAATATQIEEVPTVEAVEAVAELPPLLPTFRSRLQFKPETEEVPTVEAVEAVADCEFLEFHGCVPRCSVCNGEFVGCFAGDCRMFTVLLVSSLLSVCPKLSRIAARFNLLSERLSASRTSRNNRERATIRKTRSERLACFLRILQRAAIVTKELSSERETLRKESEKLSAYLKFSPIESQVSYRSTGGMFGHTTKETPIEIVNRLKLAQISEETVSHLQNMRERLSVLNEKVEILSRLESAIRSLRIEILHSEKAENLAQSESLSLILASMPDNRWKGCKNDKNHVCGMQGNSAESLIEFVRTPRDRTGKRNSVCSHSGRGVSTARGERLFSWSDYKKTESQWLVYSDDLAFRVHSRWSENRSVREKKDAISLAFLRQARNGKGPLAETYSFISRILSPAFFAEFEFESSDRWNRISANLVRLKLQRVHSLLLNPPEWVKEFVSGFSSQSVIELAERSKALQRLKERLSISEPGVSRQIVLSRTQRVCSFSLMFNPENFSDEIEKARNGSLPIGDNLISLLPIECENLEIGESEILPLSISRSLVLNSSGYSFEYFVTNDFGGRIPARLRDSIRFALSLHDGGTDDLGETEIRAKLFIRISENLRSRRMPFLQELQRKAGKRESGVSHLSLERKERAERLKTLRNTEIVSISDSVQTGNCRAGSLEFAARLGIHSETISGRELATRWRKYGYPENALFMRVIESLAQKLQRAERAALSE